uniref:Uncharacterized protein n=1 Tax=Oryza brachyantha TaxID=4533 RepID=J3MAV3_ORYBR
MGKKHGVSHTVKDGVNIIKSNFTVLSSNHGSCTVIKCTGIVPYVNPSRPSTDERFRPSRLSLQLPPATTATPSSYPGGASEPPHPSCRASFFLCSDALPVKSGPLRVRACLSSHHANARIVYRMNPGREVREAVWYRCTGTAVCGTLLSASAEGNLIGKVDKLFEEMPERRYGEHCKAVRGNAKEGKK